MRIAYITNARIPTEKAHGYQICKMCEEFGEAGNQVELIVPTRHLAISEEAFAFYNLKKLFSIQYLTSYDFMKYKWLGAAGFYLQSLSFFLSLIDLQLPKDTIVYTRNPEIAWLFKLCGYKTVYECHDWFGKYKRLALFFLRKSDFIIATNSYIKREFLKHGCRNHILTAPNGVDVSKFDLYLTKNSALKKVSLPKAIKEKILTHHVLIYTGSYKTMGQEKGISEILLALTSKKLSKKKVFFMAIGGNETDIAFYQKLSAKLGVSNSVYFMPKMKQKELAIYCQLGDIMLMPFPAKAHYKYFMSPLKMFEYMASKRPIIASDLPSIREVLSEEDCLFCEPGDLDDLVLQINKLCADAKLADRISASAYNKVKKYSWKNRAKQILKFLHS
ncbi:MAG: glycosyltransferase [Patescibacteria group bacterium]|nr:glycosyltransferase [Patescibacteria group bacterium]